MATEGAQNLAVTRLDSAVSEVFEMMLATSCRPLDGEVDTVDGRIVARIQFTGSLAGECLLYASKATAEQTAGALLGPVTGSDDPMVDDAIGELCNMIAGGWKSRLGSPDSSCLISVPAVTRDKQEELNSSFEKTFSRNYSFQGNVFGVVLAIA
jgi:chemotaxis protein CheX